jgi:DNA relaxase NicK
MGKCEREELDRGGLSRKWGMAGYMGARAGGLEWGSKFDGVVIRLSGDTARRWWRQFGSLSTNCSRIDLQQTVIYGESPHVTITRHFREVRRWNQKRKKERELKLWSGVRGAEAMFCGRRVSDSYLRLYHRGSKPELCQETGHLRYEVELKRLRAKHALDQLLGAESPEAIVQGTVRRMFSDVGLRLPWPKECSLTSVTLGRRDDAQKRLRWLENAIRPAVQNLIEHGYRDEVLRALGLHEEAEADKDWSN